MIEPDTDILHSWAQEIIHHLVPHTVVAVGGAGLLSHAALFSQHSIPYLRTIHDLTMFSPHDHLTQTGNVRFLQTSFG